MYGAARERASESSPRASYQMSNLETPSASFCPEAILTGAGPTLRRRRQACGECGCLQFLVASD